MEDKEIEKQLKALLETLASNIDDYDFYNNFLFNGKETMDEIFKNYISAVEGSPCCADKSRFIVSKIKKALKERANQSLQYTYQEYKDKGGDLGGIKNDLDHICYWCPETIKDTDTAINLFFTLINIESLVRQQKQLKEQIEQLKSEQSKVAVEKLEELQHYQHPTNTLCLPSCWVIDKVNEMIKELKG